MSLSTPDQIQTLQRKLYLKAKRELHKHRVQSRGEYRYPATYIYDTMGVVDVTRVLATPRTPSGRTWFESRVREVRTSGSMSGDGKSDHGIRTEAQGESLGQATGP